MAASIRRGVLGVKIKPIVNVSTGYIRYFPDRIPQRSASWKTFFKGSQPKQDEIAETEIVEYAEQDDVYEWTTEDLKKRKCIESLRGYTPPPDVEERVFSIVSTITGSKVSPDFTLTERLLKFQAFTQLEKEFDHVIPNTKLTSMTTLSDVVTFFSTPVIDQSKLESMKSSNLPKNLHIQLEPHRFNPDTDTFFDGKTAFPNRPTIVSSLKYSRKYAGNSGESRNVVSRTNYEEQTALEQAREKYRKAKLPCEGLPGRRQTFKEKGGTKPKIPII